MHMLVQRNQLLLLLHLFTHENTYAKMLTKRTQKQVYTVWHAFVRIQINDLRDISHIARA